MKTKPQRKKPKYRDIGLRATVEEIEEITRAAEAEAKELGIPYSRNNFCVRAVLTASRKIIQQQQEAQV